MNEKPQFPYEELYISPFTARREYKCPATERRRALREKGDVGRFRL